MAKLLTGRVFKSVLICTVCVEGLATDIYIFISTSIICTVYIIYTVYRDIMCTVVSQ